MFLPVMTQVEMKKETFSGALISDYLNKDNLDLSNKPCVSFDKKLFLATTNFELGAKETLMNSVPFVSNVIFDLSYYANTYNETGTIYRGTCIMQLPSEKAKEVEFLLFTGDEIKGDYREETARLFLFE